LNSSDLVIYEDQIEEIDKALIKLIKGAEAKCALLVDKDGYLITRQGFTHSLDTTPPPRKSLAWWANLNLASFFTRAKGITSTFV